MTYPSATSGVRAADRPSPATGALRVVVGASSLINSGGTETYAHTVARELQRLGHEPIMTAGELGTMADHVERSGVPLARSEAELPRECDVLFVQDAIACGQLAERYPEARVVHVAHSDVHDHQLPLLFEGAVDAVVVLSDRIVARIQALALNVPVVRLRHPIDTERFAPVGDIAERPRRALVLSNYLTGARRRALVEAWEGAGVECVQVGDPTSMALDVVPDIANADIVVGKGRVALEGMSCARAVYVYDTYAGDGWVTPENYAALEADNFAGFATEGPRTATDLARDIASYSADMGWTNRELVKAHHAARRHTIALLEVLRGAEPRRPRRVDGLAEITRLSRLSWGAERRALVLQAEADAQRARLDRVEAELAAAHAAHERFVADVGERLAEKDAHLAAAYAEIERLGGCEAEAERLRERATEAERQLAEARRVLASRRARVGLTVGQAIDRVRGAR